MSTKHLHIVCHDVPYPPDYGGVFDLFYKIKMLSSAGVQIHLHCFEYGRGEQEELNKYCTEVKYYSRKLGHKSFSHKLPYIVCSRSNHELLDDLLQDDYPILVEGIHCSYLLNDPRFNDRKIILRLHNVEWLYYKQLYQTSTSFFKKLYYLHESKTLKQYEQSIADKALTIAVSEQDIVFYKEEFGAKNIYYLPVFLPFDRVMSQTGKGCYCLYHGNLSVAENEKTVIWLLEEVFNDLSLPVVIAGKNPSAYLEKMIEQHSCACLVADPSEDEMQDIIGKAQVNVLPSFNCTGIKLKLLNALFNGRHCVVNEQTIKNTGLEDICHIGSDPYELKDIISEIFESPFEEEEIERRKNILLNHYDNEKNVQQLIQWIW
ncbi:MAG: glycosyltransferase [Bacteroidetes bacterium]|nr:glycosyltransferase [Bacteroidota bacterium]